MKNFTMIPGNIWARRDWRTIATNGTDHLAVAFYLLTSHHSNMLGLYHLPMAYLSNDTMIPEEKCRIIIKKLIANDFCRYEEVTETAWVVTACDDQIGHIIRSGNNGKIAKIAKKIFSSIVPSPVKTNFRTYYGDLLWSEERNATGANDNA